jgi:pectate lyase-like protein
MSSGTTDMPTSLTHTRRNRLVEAHCGTSIKFISARVAGITWFTDDGHVMNRRHFLGVLPAGALTACLDSESPAEPFVASPALQTDSVVAPPAIQTEPANALSAIVNVKDFGAMGDWTTDDYDSCQAALDYALSLTLDYMNHPHGVILYFPTGYYNISNSLSWYGSSEAFFKLRIMGDGKHQSIIMGINPDNDIFHFEQTGAGYVGWVNIEHIQLYYGRHAVYCDNFSYSEFNHVCFRGNGNGGSERGSPSIKLAGNTVMARINNCNFVHGGDVLDCTNGNVHMTANTIGEDVGNIRVRGSLNATGNFWHGSGVNKLDPNGLFGMGGASVSVEGESRALFSNNTIGPISSSFLNVDQADVDLTNNDFFLYDGGRIARTRRSFGPHHGVTLRGGFVRAKGLGNGLIDGVQGYKPSNAIIDAVRVRIEINSELTVDPSINDPTYNNYFGLNPGLII